MSKATWTAVEWVQIVGMHNLLSFSYAIHSGQFRIWNSVTLKFDMNLWVYKCELAALEEQLESAGLGRRTRWWRRWLPGGDDPWYGVGSGGLPGGGWWRPRFNDWAWLAVGLIRTWHVQNNAKNGIISFSTSGCMWWALKILWDVCWLWLRHVFHFM